MDKWRVFLFFLFFTVYPLLAAEPELIIVEAYEKYSFSPTQGEIFFIPISMKSPDKVKKIQIELYSSDGDKIKTLILDDFHRDKMRYEIPWMGTDHEGHVVPDEAYQPVFIITDHRDKIHRIDRRSSSGGEEVYDFEKHIRPGVIEYTLPVSSRLLVRSGIKNGPMLRTIVDWAPRTPGFHAERWNGRDLDNVIAVEQNSQVGYLILGYQLPDHSIITYGNNKETYRAYRERKQWPIRQAKLADRLLERNAKLVRPEFYTPVLQQKSQTETSGFFVVQSLGSGVAIFSRVTWTTLEEIVIELGIGGEVYHFASSEFLGGFEYNLSTVVIVGFVVFSKTNAVDVFAAFGSVSRRHFIFREDRRKRAFGHTSAAIDAGIGINVNHREAIGRVAGDDTFNGAYFDATAVAYTETGNNMGHATLFSLL